MTFGITPEGFVLKTFEDIRAEIDDYQWSKIDGELDLSDDSPLGQQNVSVALELADLWELGQALYSSFDTDTATGWSLDKIASVTGTTRSKYSYTEVTGQVTMEPDKPLPLGSIAHLTNNPNTRFISQAEVPGDPAGGTFDVLFKAENPGSIQVEVGKLNQISVAVDGWLSVDNSAAASIIGSAPEDDPEFRQKREDELEEGGSTHLAAIIAGVRDVNGVLAVVGVENKENYPVNGLLPHSFEITVRGGNDADIAEAIYTDHPTGISSQGTTSVEYTDEEGETQDIKFTRAGGQDVFVELEYQRNIELWGPNTESETKTAIANYINGLNLGGEALEDEVRARAIAQDGIYNLGALKMDTVNPPVATGDLAIAPSAFAQVDVANITLVELPDV